MFKKTFAAMVVSMMAVVFSGCEDPASQPSSACAVDGGIDGRFDPTTDTEGGAFYVYQVDRFQHTESVLVRVRSNAAHRLTVLWAPGCVLENLVPTYEDPNLYRGNYAMPVACDEAGVDISAAEVRIQPCGHGSLTFTTDTSTGNVEW